MSSQRVDDAYMASWFAFKPVSKPAPEEIRRRDIPFAERAAKRR